MYFPALAVTLLAAGASAASSSTPAVVTTSTSAPAASSTGNSSSTDLPGLIAQLPQCALQCFATSAGEIGCAASDLTCLCGNSSALLGKLGPCVILSSCSSSDISKASTLAQEICTDVGNNPSPSELASASSEVNQALATVTASAAANGQSNAAAPPQAGVAAAAALGLAGVMAAFAL